MAGKTVIIIAGPTAAGKTAAAINAALRFETEVISADSRQCFRELTIGVARPSMDELQMVPHHFIASHSIHDKFTAADFETYALGITNRLFNDHDKIIMTGGTGLYLKAFCEGFDPIPSISDQTRSYLVKKYESEGFAWLKMQLEELDPRYALEGEMKNPQRMLRALEVVKETGKSIMDYRKGHKATRTFRVKKYALDLSREELYDRIERRVDKMIEDGLVEEVRMLLPWRSVNALQTVGYNELFDYFDGKFSLPEAVNAIKTNTRRYAKRQLTWFRRDPEIQWITPAQVEAITA